MDDNDNLRALAKLLKKSSSQKTPKISPTTKCEAPIDTTNESMAFSIFDINKDDRYKILKLLEQLIDAQDNVDQLAKKLDDERAEFREKRSKLIKKLDQLSENHGRTLSDINMLKDRYSDNLKQLEEKISTVSVKLEASVVENNKLREANENLIKENAGLRKLHTDATAIISSFQEEKSKITLQMEGHKQKEKVYRKQLKKVISELKNNDTSNISRFEDMSTFRQRNSFADINYFKKENDYGSGDHVNDKNSTVSEIESIKTPAIVIFDKRTQPALNTAASNTKIVSNVSSFNNDVVKQPPLYRKNDLDTAILEDLFFRF